MDSSDCVSEIDQIKLATAKIELLLKERELREKPSFWMSALASPAFMATVLTVCITVATTLISWDSARRQKEAEAERAKVQAAAEEAKNTAEMNLRIVIPIIFAKRQLLAEKLKLFLDTGLLKDNTGAFRKAQEQLEALGPDPNER
jgi:hypothetical protein